MKQRKKESKQKQLPTRAEAIFSSRKIYTHYAVEGVLSYLLTSHCTLFSFQQHERKNKKKMFKNENGLVFNWKI